MHLNSIIFNNKFNIDEIKINYLKLLNNLSETKNIDNQLFINNIKKFFNSGLIIVAYIENENKFVGSGTILIEPKLSHSGKNVGHLEDIEVDPLYRNKGIGKNITNYLIRYAKTHNCYKIILNCEENKIKYYQKFGFKNNNSEMKLLF